jgi:hypothetical protein
MKKNIGKYDRTIRIVLGLVIIGLGVIFKSYFGLLGLIPLVTAIFSFCPLYAPFRISTREKS